ncbi:unnamed protein product, partial [Aphanomyces euteiches]
MHRQRISLADKLKIKEEHNRFPEKTHDELADWAKHEFKLTKRLDRSTVSKILKYPVVETLPSRTKSQDRVQIPDIKTELYEWIK